MAAASSEGIMKVLVIDDDSIVLEVVTAALQDMGHEATARASAVGASTWILQERPDLVLVDLNMPTLPGEEWLAQITQVGLMAGDSYAPHFVLLSKRSVEEL